MPKKRKEVRKIVAEEIEIIVTARVEEALKEFKKMLPEIKKQMGQIQQEFGKVDMKSIAKNVDFSKVTKQVKEANKEVQKAKKTISNAFEVNFKSDNINQKIEQYENKIKELQKKMNKTQLDFEFVEENKKYISKRKKPNEDLGSNQEYVKLDKKSQTLERDMRSYASLIREARMELEALNQEASQRNNDVSGINFQNVKREINGISTEFQKMKGSNFALGNMIDLQKYKKKIEEIKPVVQQVGEEISKVGFMKYDTKSIENFIDNYKKEPDGGDISGMKINGIDSDKVNDDLSNIGELKKYQENIKEIGTEAEKSKQKVQELSNVKFVDYSQMQAKDMIQPQTGEVPNQSAQAQIAPSQNSMSMWDVLRAKIAQVKPYIEEFKNSLQGSGSSKELELLNYKISEIEEKLQGGVKGEIHLSTKEIVEAEAELERLNNRKEKLEKSGDGSNLFAKMASSIGKVMPKLNGMSGITIKIKNQMKQMSTGMKQGLGHILKYAGALFSLRSIYSTLSSSASSWLSSQNAGAKQLSTNIDYMKNSMGSAFAPVIQWITGLIYNLMKAIQSVVYALFKVNIFANASAKSYASMASGAKKAKDETKQLLGVHDEINNIQDSKADSAGGSGGGVAPSFDLSKVDPSSSIMDAIANGDWYQVGALLAQKLNEAMASIDWGAIQEKTILIATNIGNFINGAVDNLDWNLLGYTIGQGINTAFMFADTLLTTIDFENIGRAIGETLKTGIATIQWDVIGQTFANGLNAIINIAYGFVTTFPWTDFGVAIGTAVNNFFGNIEWATAGQTVSEGIKGIFSSINTTLATVDWHSIGEDVATFLQNIDWLGILTSVGETITGAIGASIDIVSGLLGEDSESIITALTIAFGGLTAAIGLYKIGLLTMHAAQIKENMLAVIDTMYKGGQAIATGLCTAATWLFNAALTVLTSPITLVVIAIAAVIAIIVLCVKHWDEIKEKVSEVVSNIKEKVIELKDKVVEKFTEIKDNVIEKCNNIKTKAQEIWENIKSTIKEKIDNVKTNISNTLNNIKTKWDDIWTNLKTTVSDVWNGIWNTIKGFINNILGGIENFANGIVRGINTVLSGLDGIMNAVGQVIGLDIHVSPLSEISLPRLATGNVAYDETLAIFGEYSNASSNPEITTPQNIMADTFRDVLSEFNGNAQSIELTVNVGNEKLGRILLDDLRSIKRQTGKDIEVIVGG